jgi:peptidoglycan/xylan/chitin deacetylase (PgdA/CDA1 family)
MSRHLRIDRLLTLSFFRHLRHVNGVGGAKFLPILMYHSIVDDYEDTVSYYGVTTGVARFSSHMEYLKSEGYHVLSMARVIEMLAKGGPCDSDMPCVAITFDDGYRDNFTNAFPILKTHGFPATIYLATAYVGDRRQAFKGRECLTWDEVLEMQHEGIEFGSHTVNHPDLRSLDGNRIRNELSVSRDIIEQKLGCPVKAFSYPYAFPEVDLEYVARLKNIIAESGYASCVTTILGRVRAGDDPFLLKRLPVNSGDDVSFLQAKILGAYDWMHGIQIFSKHIDRHRRNRA